MTSHDIVRIVLLICLTIFSGMVCALAAYMWYSLMQIFKMEHDKRMRTKD